MSMGRGVKLEGYKCLDFERSSVSFALKRHDPATNVYSKGKSPAAIKRNVLASPRIRKVVREVAENSGISVEATQAEAEVLIDEIAHKIALPAVRTVAAILRSALIKILDAIYVNEDGLKALAEMVTKWPVVLLPSHRSYLDFILISYIMFEHDIVLPCIAAGQDFMSMKGVSPLLRRSGAFFLRRTFGSDKLYKAVFSEYVKTVLYSGDYPMEFFVEGTRSRTGKSLHPRLGLLSMVVEPYLNGCLPDTLMVPISISYERTLEELLFARELLGVPKPKESTTALFRAHSILSERYGSIIVHIGMPISLHEMCQKFGISRIPNSLLPREMSALLPKDWRVVQALGGAILDHFHNGMKVFPTSLVATVLLLHPRGIQFDVLVDLVKWVEQQITIQGGQVVVKLEKSHEDMAISGLAMLPHVLHRSMDDFVTISVPHEIDYEQVHAVAITEILESKIDSCFFEKLCEIALAYLQLAYYRNQLLHLFVEEAMLALCLAPENDYETLLKVFSALHCALASEFVFPQKSPTKTLENNLEHFLSRNILQEERMSRGRRLFRVQWTHCKYIRFLQDLLFPFVGGVWVVCHYLLSLDGGVQSLTATIRGAQLLAAKCLYHKILNCYEILSLGIVKNALTSLHQEGLTLQAFNEFGTGKDRLVKVIKKDQLKRLIAILDQIVANYMSGKMSNSRL